MTFRAKVFVIASLAAALVLATMPLAHAGEGGLEAPLISDIGYVNGKATTTSFPILGGTGTYVFTGNITGASDVPPTASESCLSPGLKPHSTDPVPFKLGDPSAGCHIVSPGAFTNIVCGTGSAGGVAHIGGDATESPVTYSINFAAGLGLLTGVSGPDSPGETSGDTWVGLVRLSDPQGIGLDNCAKGFQIDAVVVALEF